eukprot:Hpha_TRINITY_DN15638_c4_g2::TRINITY_DN15638_c4_g2_i1::g.98308::m.98308
MADDGVPPYRVYIGGLPEDVTEEQILAFLRPADAGLCIQIARTAHDDRDPQPCRGFAHASCSSSQKMQSALKLNGKKLFSGGPDVQVREAKPHWTARMRSAEWMEGKAPEALPPAKRRRERPVQADEDETGRPWGGSKTDTPRDTSGEEKQGEWASGNQGGGWAEQQQQQQQQQQPDQWGGGWEG